MSFEEEEIRERLRNDLEALSNLLESHNYRIGELTELLANTDDTKLWGFLTSNTLWGGAGSIADQALLEISTARLDLEEILIRIGRLQEAVGRTNVRTAMWLSFFEGRSKSN